MSKMTFGDFQLWMTQNLHEELTKIIMEHQHLDNPYYMIVIPKKGYHGPPAKNLVGCTNTKTMDLEGKTVFTNRIIIMHHPPAVPLLGSALWKVDNKKGKVDNIYVLPPDTPTLRGGNEEQGSELVFKSGQNMPLFYSENRN